MNKVKSSQQGQGRKRLRCLVLLPFKATSSALEHTIFQVLKENGVEPYSFREDLPPGALWVDAVYRLLRSTDFVIADVSQNDPNIMFELGVAHGLGKPFVTLISSNSANRPPTDLAGYQFISYDPQHLYGLKSRLGSFVEYVSSRAEAGE